MLTKNIYIIPLLLLLVGCFEEDERLPPYDGHVITIDKNIEHYQVYFDFEKDTIIKSEAANVWQLGFECGKNGWHIITNSGDNWFLFNTKQSDLLTTSSFPTGSACLYDVQSAYPDSTAAGNWLENAPDGPSSKKEVYLLGKPAGLSYSQVKKIVFLSTDSSSYRFYYQEEETGFSDTITITKADSVNFVYYSFSEKKQLCIEPYKLHYDLVFCPYFDLATLFGETIPYLVRGVLLNTYETTAVTDSVDNYYDITLETLNNYSLQPQRDAIGYRWKDVVVDAASGNSVYSVNLNYSYLIRTAEGNVYKMRFLSFMVGSESGYPQFEYEFLGRN